MGKLQHITLTPQLRLVWIKHQGKKISKYPKLQTLCTRKKHMLNICWNCQMTPIKKKRCGEITNLVLVMPIIHLNPVSSLILVLFKFILFYHLITFFSHLTFPWSLLIVLVSYASHVTIPSKLQGVSQVPFAPFKTRRCNLHDSLKGVSCKLS